MKSQITIHDVAKKAGVSKTTVSRFLNQKFEYMSEATKLKIENVIQEMDYRPSKQAQYLKSKKSSLIGLIVADIENLYTAFMIKAVQATLQAQDYQVIIMNSNNSLEEEQRSIYQLLDQNIAGLLLQPVSNTLLDFERLEDSSIPVVLYDRYLDDFKWPIVQSNNYQVTKQLANEIVKKGYDKIIHVSEKLGKMSARMERHEAMLTSATLHNVEFELIEVSKDFDAVAHYIENDRRDKKTAFFAANGDALYKIISTFQDKDISFPDDYGVCGFDDWFWAELVKPGITSIHQEPYKIGERAAQVLLSLIDGEKIKEKIEINATICYRHSL